MFSTRGIFRVLVIEDNPGDFLLIQEYFREELENPHLIHCTTFAEAKEIISEENSLDAILLDLSLPDASGQSLVSEMVNIAKHIPVIVLTGYEDKDFGIKTLSQGVSDYLLKDELSPSILAKSIIYSIERKRINRQLEQAEEQRKKHHIELTKAIITAQEKERVEIGGELHDNINQILLAAKMNLRLAQDERDKESSLEWIGNTNNYIEMAIDEIRSLSHRLAPRSFKESSLIEAYKNLLESVNLSNKFNIVLTHKNFNEKHLQEDVKLNLFRILQEQVKNILKYSEATRIEVNLCMEKGVCRMRIYDNGKGFDVDNVKYGIGLNNIKQRTEVFFGSFRLNTAIGQGCEIIIDIPVQ